MKIKYYTQNNIPKEYTKLYENYNTVKEYLKTLESTIKNSAITKISKNELALLNAEWHTLNTLKNIYKLKLLQYERENKL